MNTRAEQASGRGVSGTGLLQVVARVLLAYFFVTMGIEKIGDPIGFLKAIREYEMLPTDPPYSLNLTAVLLPWLELACGMALLIGLARRGVSLTVLVMLATFTSAIFWRAMEIYRQGQIALTAIEFDCGCGAGPEVVYLKLLKNLGFMALALLVLVSRSNWLTCEFCKTNAPMQPLVAASPASATANAS